MWMQWDAMMSLHHLFCCLLELCIPFCASAFESLVTAVILPPQLQDGEVVLLVDVTHKLFMHAQVCPIFSYCHDLSCLSVDNLMDQR